MSHTFWNKGLTLLGALLGLFLVSSANAGARYSGTSFVIVVTDEGIVVGADVLRLRSFTGNSRKPELVPMPLSPKFRVCATNVVCGITGSSNIEFGASPNDPTEIRKCGHFKFDFDSWLPQIETDAKPVAQGAPATVARLIWEKAQSTFANLSCYMKLPQGKFLKEGDGPFMFLVAGYSEDSELAQFYAIKIQLDPDKRELRFPNPEKIFPQCRTPKLPRTFFAGFHSHMDAARGLSEPERSAFSSFLYQRRIVAKAVFQDATPSLQEAAATAASYLDVEGRFNPMVGGGSSITILRKGKPTILVQMPPISPSN